MKLLRTFVVPMGRPVVFEEDLVNNRLWVGVDASGRPSFVPDFDVTATYALNLTSGHCESMLRPYDWGSRCKSKHKRVRSADDRYEYWLGPYFQGAIWDRIAQTVVQTIAAHGSDSSCVLSEDQTVMFSNSVIYRYVYAWDMSDLVELAWGADWTDLLCVANEGCGS